MSKVKHRSGGLSFPAGQTRVFEWQDIAARNANSGINITERTAVTRWAGESMDYSIGVQVLLEQQRKGKRVPAGTA